VETGHVWVPVKATPPQGSEDPLTTQVGVPELPLPPPLAQFHKLVPDGQAQDEPLQTELTGVEHEGSEHELPFHDSPLGQAESQPPVVAL
jgi:hypothetical protein